MRSIIQSGVEGLDIITGGGLPRGWFIVVSGGPGTGKTTLSLEFLYQGAVLFNERGMLITLNETSDVIYDVTSNFNWDMERLEEEGSLKILDLSTTGLRVVEESVRMGKMSIGVLIDQIHQEILSFGVDRLVIDPLNLLSMLFKDSFNIRRELHTLVNWLLSRNITTLSTLELKESEITRASFSIEEFLAYGVFRCYYVKAGAMRERAIEILKLRGMDHSRFVYPFEITSEGAKIKTDSPILLA